MPGRKRKSPQSPEGEPPRKLVKDSPRLQTLPATNSSTPLSLRRAGTLMVEPGRSPSPSPSHKSIPCVRTESSTSKFVMPVTQANRCEKPTCIPSGLTKLALTSSGSNLSLQVSTSDLLPNVDEAEMTSALASLKDTDDVEWDPSKPAVEQVSMHKLPAIPSGLTNLAFASSDSNRSLNIPGGDLIETIDDVEMASALQSLKSTRSYTKYETRQRDNVKKDDDTEDQSEIKKTISKTTESGAIALQSLTTKEPTCKLFNRYLDDPKNVDATERSELKKANTNNKSELLNLQTLTSENPKQYKLEFDSGKSEKGQKKTKAKDELEPMTSVTSTPVVAVTNTCGPFEVVVLMHGELEEVRTYVKNFTKTLKEYIPDVRLAVVSSDEYNRNTTDGLIRYQDFTESLEKVFTFVDTVERTFGRQVRTTYNRMMKVINEQLSWTCRGRGEIVHIGDYDSKKRFNMAEHALRIAQCHGYVSSEAVSNSETTASSQSEVKKPLARVKTPSVRTKTEQGTVPVAKNKKKQIGKAGVSAGVRCSGGSVEQSMIPNSSHTNENTMDRRKTRISKRIQSKERFKLARNKMKTTNGINNRERAKLSDKEVSATAENPKQSKLECDSRKKGNYQKKTKTKDQLEPGKSVTSTPVATVTNTSGPFEVAVLMHGGLEEVRTYVKDFTKTLKEYIPDVRLAVVSGGEYTRNENAGLIRYQDLTDSLQEIFSFVDTVERIFGGDGGTTYNRMMKEIHEKLSWTCRGRGLIVHIGDYDVKKRFNMAEQALRIAKSHGYVSSEALSDSKTTASPQSEVKKPHLQVKTPAIGKKNEQGIVPISKTRKRLIRKSFVSDGIRYSSRLSGGSVKQSIVSNSIQAKEKIKNRKITRISKRIQSKERSKLQRNKMKTTIGINNNERTKIGDKETSATSKYKFRTKKIEKLARKHQGPMKIGQCKVNTKQTLLREELADNDVLANSSNKLLKWSDWVLAISETPPGHLRASFKKPRNSHWYQRKDIGDEINVETLFEFGVKLARSKKIYAVYFWNGYHCEANKGRLTDYLFRFRKRRMEVKRLMKDKCQIYVRRASGTGKDKTTQQINMKQAVDFIKTIDYAWLGRGKERHRKVIKNKTLISDNTL